MNLLKALATISSMTLVSRILAFIRDILIARIFGAGAATACHGVTTRLGKPGSTTGGTSGRLGCRVVAVAASAFIRRPWL